ncbi:MAG TPA: aspartyl protease family protein [Candidatus Baltobacteraceae bacterium]|nr:aspartyl protease family protein [Candidatus Baltobacteraceae bacterium]
MSPIGSRLLRVVLATAFTAIVALPIAPRSRAGADDARSILRAGDAAIGGAAFRAAAGLQSDGSLSEGGATGTFTQTLDVRNGHERVHVVVGPLDVYQGFDGSSWTANNGIVSVSDLPASQAEAITEAYLSRDAWGAANDPAQISLVGKRVADGVSCDVVRAVPPGGVAIELWFDSTTHVLARAVIDADNGPETDTFSDYRPVGGALLNFRQTTTESDGSVTDVRVQHAQLVGTLAPGALARPAPVEHGALPRGMTQTTVRFRYNQGSSGNVVIPIAVGGKPPFEVVFDSGGVNVVTPDAARRLGLVGTGGIDVGGVGTGTERATIANAGTLAIGDARLSDQQFLVLDLPYAFVHAMRDVTTDGIVGFEVLANFRTTIDYAARTVTFAPFSAPAPAPLPGAVTLPFRSDGHTPYVEATIDGATGLFEVDTGNSGGLIVFEPFARAHGLFATAPRVPYVSPGGIGGSVPATLVRGGEFTLAGVTLRRPIVQLANQPAGGFASRTIAGNIGADVLQRYTVTFDYRARTVTFAPNGQSIPDFPTDRTGLSLNQHDPGSVDVIGVAPGSPAAVAGVRVGDEIVAVNGRPVAQYGDTELSAAIHGLTGPVLRLTLRRGGATTEVRLTPREMLP